MEQNLEIFVHGAPVGTLNICDEGLYTRFTARCRYNAPGIHRLWLTRREDLFLLGVLTPEGDCLCLSKRLSRRQWAPPGSAPVTGCILADSEPALPQSAVSLQPSAEWQPCPEPAKLFADPELAAVCPGEGVLCRSEADSVLLAFPLLPGAPFPLLPVFLFGCTEDIGAIRYVVFRLKNGVCC